MASWAAPPPWSDSADKDAAFCWPDPNNDNSGDFDHKFMDLLDFSNIGPTDVPPLHPTNGHGINLQAHQQNLNPVMPTMAGNSFLDQSNGGESTISSGFSTGDEFDFLSSSSHPEQILSNSHTNAGHEIDPRTLVIETDLDMQPSHLDYMRQVSISDTDLPNMDSMSLHSPVKARAGTSRPSSPTPIQTEKRGRKFIDALSTTVKKATALRRGRKQQQQNEPSQRDGSPTLPDEPVQPLKQRRAAANRKKLIANTRAANNVDFPTTPPEDFQNSKAVFAQGHNDDPFIENPQVPNAAYMRYYSHGGFEQPLESPGIESEPGAFANDTTVAHMSQAWPLPTAPNSAPTAQWNDPTVANLRDPNQGLQPQQDETNTWWQGPDGNMMQAGNDDNSNSHIQTIGFKFPPPTMQDGSGLIIHMPQPGRHASLQAISHAHPDSNPNGLNHNNLPLTEQVYLPPPPPIPDTSSDRNHRPAPRARSSGARHLSCSPVRNANNNPRAPSASPTRNGSNNNARPSSHMRHSSNGSTASLRSSSGRGPGSMPGTPCSIRKRRSSGAYAGLVNGIGSPSKRSPSKSRQASVSSVGGGSGGGGGSNGDGGFGGFVNFTPNDGASLMVGVAPSGSSKTKARREKEAMERRKKLSEAAMKAVAAAGGDVDKLIEQGFEF